MWSTGFATDFGEDPSNMLASVSPSEYGEDKSKSKALLLLLVQETCAQMTPKGS